MRPPNRNLHFELNGFIVKLGQTDDHRNTERLEIDSPQGFLVATLGPSKSIADMFGHEQNPARWKFLRSLKAPVAWIDSIKIRKGFRDQGMGTLLMNTALQVMAESGIRYVVLSPRPESEESRERLDNFYRRFGFTEIRAYRGKPLWWRLLILDLAHWK